MQDVIVVTTVVMTVVQMVVVVVVIQRRRGKVVTISDWDSINFVRSLDLRMAVR